MKRIIPFFFAMLFLLAACGQKPLSGVSTNEDNSISATAEEGLKDGMAIGYAPDDFIGNWAEKYAGRCNVEIEKKSDDLYGIRVFWSSSATEMSYWTMTASPVGGNVLRYSDCRHSSITLSEDEAETEVVEYENGTGEFTLLSTYELMWQDDVGHAGEDVLFVNEG